MHLPIPWTIDFIVIYIPHHSISFATTTPNNKSFERNRRINNRDLAEEEEEEKEDKDEPEITPQPYPFVTATAAAAAAAAAAPTAPFDAENTTTTTNPTMCTVVYETWICTDCGYTHVVLPYIIDGCPGLLAGRASCSRWRDIGFEREYVCNACNLCRRAAGLPMDLGDPLARP